MQPVGAQRIQNLTWASWNKESLNTDQPTTGINLVNSLWHDMLKNEVPHYPAVKKNWIG